MINSSLAINPNIFPRIPFDILKDFTPIALLGLTPAMMVVHPSLNVSALKELSEMARASPGKLTYGSCGNGTPQHLAGELYRFMAGINIVHVPYRGCSPALSDVLGGQIQIAMVNGSLAAPHVKSGRLRGLAMTSQQRFRPAPEVPTFDEAGFKGFDLSIWYGLMAPAGIPRAIVGKVHRDTMSMIKSPDVRTRLEAAGIEEFVGSGESLARLFRADIPKYAGLVKRAGIKLD